MEDACFGSDRIREYGCRIWHFMKGPLFIVIIIGLAARLILAPLLTYNFDVSGWATVIENIESGNGLYGLAGYYYAPPWGYILGFVSQFQDLFLSIADFGEKVSSAIAIEGYTDWFFTSDLTTVSFNVFIKIPLFICDIVVGYLVYWLVDDMTGDKKKSVTAFAIWFLCPFVIVVAGVGGMFDTFAALMLLLAVIFVRKERFFLAGAMFSLAFLTKLFPAFLLFALVGYILMRHRGDGTAYWKIGYAAAGFFVMAAVVLVPEIAQGNLSDCFSFLTSRVTSGMDSNLGGIESYGTVIAYVAIIIVSMLIGWKLSKSRSGDPDRKFMFVCMVTLAILFLFPSAPQYLIILVPFVAVYISVYSKEYVRPFTVLSIGTTLFVLASNFTLLLSFAEYTGIIDINTVLSLADWFQTDTLGMSKMSWVYYIGGVTQWVGVLLMVITAAKEAKLHSGHGGNTMPEEAVS